MKKIRTERVLLPLVFFAVLIAFSTALLLVRQETGRRRAEMEYRSYQILTVLMDRFSMGEAPEPGEWSDVTGFAVYGSSGTPVYRWGMAPERLSMEDLQSEGYSRFIGSSLRVVRRIGFLPPHRMDAPQHRMPRKPSDMMRFNRIVLIERDVSRPVRLMRLVILGVLLSFILFLAVVIASVRMVRELDRYRSRERDTVHLIQLGEAARTLAHEIKNPLGVIRIQCATLKRLVPDTGSEQVKLIEDETERLALLADRIREFLHNSPGRIERCEVRTVCADFKKRYAGFVDVTAPDTDVFVLIDPLRLTHIVDNLIANAREADPAGTTALEVSGDEQRVFLRVLDRGPGIAPDRREIIFDLFYTTKASGSGLGLSIARRYASIAGGNIEYSERPGGGSVFTLTLPRAT